MIINLLVKSENKALLVIHTVCFSCQPPFPAGNLSSGASHSSAARCTGLYLGSGFTQGGALSGRRRVTDRAAFPAEIYGNKSSSYLYSFFRPW